MTLLYWPMWRHRRIAKSSVVGLLMLVFAILFAGENAHAHQSSLAFVTITDSAEKITAQVKVSLLDLEGALGIDADLDGRITWGEAKARLNAIHGYVQSRLSFDAAGTCVLHQQSARPTLQAGESYLALSYGLKCPDSVSADQFKSQLFRDLDPGARTLVHVENSDGVRSFVADTSASMSGPVNDSVGSGTLSGLVTYFWQGLEHLFAGLDHMLFLAVLIAPAIYTIGGKWRVARAILLPISGFTLGHALTLTAAASGLLRPEPRTVETLIALTILVTAIDNVRPFLPGPRSLVALVFGLIHGFGFAGALGVLDLEGWALAASLLGFNLGIEAGQALVALAIVPVLYWLRVPLRRFHFAPVGLSVIAGCCAVYWLLERLGVF